MIIVVLTKYSDAPSENLYTGEDWKAAWDMFAAAALTGLISGVGHAQRFVIHECDEAANYADRMMEQRKSRMG